MHRLTAPFRWVRRRLTPPVVDVLLALGVTAAGIGSAFAPDRFALRDDAWIVLPLALLQSVPLVMRRRRPVGVFAVSLAAAVVMGSFFVDNFLPIGTIVALYSVAAYAERRRSKQAALAGAIVVAVAITADSGTWVDAIPVIAIGLAAWVLGDNLRTRRAYLRALEERAVRLEREREEHARRAAAEEQARIARELHDVIAHSVSVMVVQAAAAGDVFDAQPARAREALASIEATGRQALGELRRMLGVVRRGEEAAAGYAPQPGLDRLDDLAQQVRAAGLPVDVDVAGETVDVPVGVDLSAYRIVQEALTNTLKHAAASRASVAVRYAADELRLEIRDDGRGVVAGAGNGGGQGLIGMRERVALYGGELHAGPRPDGGFAVQASFPLGEAAVT